MNESVKALTLAMVDEKKFPFSEEFLAFIYQDEMDGIFDLFAMTKNVKVARRIPYNIRCEYENHYFVAGEILDKVLEKNRALFNTLSHKQPDDDSEISYDGLKFDLIDSSLVVSDKNVTHEEILASAKDMLEKLEAYYLSNQQELKVYIIDQAVSHYLEKHSQGTH